MAKSNENSIDLKVTFVGLKDGEQAPHFAAYQIDSAGRPVRKLGGYDGKALRIDLGKARSVTLGPDVEDFKTLPKESLASYRVRTEHRSLAQTGYRVAARYLEPFSFSFSLRHGNRAQVPAVVLGSDRRHSAHTNV